MINNNRCRDIRANFIRSSRANALVLIAGAVLVVFLVLGYFAFNYASLQGTSAMQNTAIESAAITAAADLSRIVYDDPNFGYIALSDHPPIAPSQNGKFASDGYPLSVQSINTLIGTVLLDSQVVNNLSLDPGSQQYMSQLVQSDYSNVVAAAQGLSSTLNSAINGSGNVKDWYDNTVNILADAQAAYKNNLGNGLTAGGINGQNNQLSLQLGYLSQVNATNIPTPNNYFNYTTTGDANKYCYKSNINYSDPNGKNYVFSAIGDSVQLINNKLFSTQPMVASRLLIPTIVKAVVNQQVNVTPDGKNTQTLTKIACAEPYNQLDPKPNPGALTIRFPQGFLPNLVSPISIITDPSSQNPIPTGTGPYTVPAKTQPNSLSVTSLQPVSGPNTVSQATVTALYHWLRHAGVKPVYQPLANSSSVPSAINGSNPVIAVGDINTVLNTSFTNPSQVVLKVVAHNTGTPLPNTNNTNSPVYDKYYPVVYTYTFDVAGQVVGQMNNIVASTGNPSSNVFDKQLLFYASAPVNSPAPPHPKNKKPKNTPNNPGQANNFGYYNLSTNDIASPPGQMGLLPTGVLPPVSVLATNSLPLINSITSPAISVAPLPVGSPIPSGSVPSLLGPVGPPLLNSLNSATDDDDVTQNFKTPKGHSVPSNTWTQFNATIRDNSFNLGKTNGGSQAGTPNHHNLPAVISSNPVLSNFGNNSLIIRPSYLANGTVADLRFFTSYQFSGDVSPTNTADYNSSPLATLTNPNN